MKIIKILSFILISIVILALISIVITDIKGCSKVKPVEVATEELTNKTTKDEQTTQEPTEETEETSEVPTEETTTSITTEETSEEGVGGMNVIDAKIQGYILDIDYENKIITIKNEITGEIEKLDDFSDYFSVSHYGSKQSKEFEDIKVGYYIFAMTEKERHFDFFYEPTDRILEIVFSEEFPHPELIEE